MDICVKAGNLDDISLGRALISSGKVGCIVLAGGDGSRLGWDGPKGTFPLSLVKQKNLFQMLSERVHAACTYYEQELKLAIMTSPINHEITKQAFSEKVDFFSQNMTPLLDMNKNFLEEKRPNGNGEVLKCFYTSGLFDQWKASGIEYVQIIFIDNPLAEPYDPNQIGIQFKKGAEVTLKAVKRINSQENVGVIGIKEGKLCVIEYSENPPLEWDLANTSLFCFSMSFIEKIKDIDMPLHLVKKFLQSKPIFKQETFIFDLLAHEEKTEVILYPREMTFAPLKNREDVGPVQRALLERDKRALFAINKNEIKERIFELDAAFHYPTESLKKKWENCELPKASYIEP